MGLAARCQQLRARCPGRRPLQDQVLGGIDNSLSRLGRRSWTIFCFWAELEDLAGVVGEDE